ncbi:MAG: paraquat-inducible protein A [Gammaproteobacteria bacterium]
MFESAVDRRCSIATIAAEDDRLPPVLAACHECDLLNQVPALEPGAKAYCIRCNAVLCRNPPNCIENGLALTLSSLFLYIVANSFAFLKFGTPGNLRTTSLVTGIETMWQEGEPLLAALIATVGVIMPGLMIVLSLYVLLPLYLGRRVPDMIEVFRALLHVREWAMVEVFVVGILVAYVKLAAMADLVPGVSAYAFALLMITQAWTLSAVEPRIVWRRLKAVA